LTVAIKNYNNGMVLVNFCLYGQCTVPQNFQAPPNAVDFFDLVKACEGVFLMCFLGQTVT